MLLNLPFTKDKKEKPLPYYAVELSDEMAKVAVWQVDEGVVSVIRTSEVITVTGSKMDDYLQAVDMAIATVTVDGELEPKEVLYGLPPEWVDEKGVVVARRSLLKFISEKLQLKPLGFVMIIDALIEYLRLKQSTPPSALFIRFRKQYLDICLVSLGKMEKMETVGRSNDIVADVKEGLVRMKNKNQFPPGIILFDGYLDFEDIKQQLMTVAWEQEFNFGHAPVIESLTRDMTVEAVALAAGKEASKQNTVDNFDTEPATNINLPTSSVPIPKTDTMPSEQALPEGFAVGLAPNEEKIGEIAKETAEIQDLSESQNAIGIEMPSEEINENSKPDLNQTIQKTLTSAKIPLSIRIKKGLKAMNLLHIFHKSPQVPSLDEEISESQINDIDTEYPKKRLPWWIWLAGGLFLLLLLGAGGVWAFVNLPKADIQLTIKSQPVEQEVTFIISTLALEMDEQNLILPAKEVESSASGSQTVPTTGSKRIGKSAAGKVTIYNKTDKIKSFAKGTILSGPGSLRYELADEVKVASKSAVSTGEGETVTFGKEDVAIVAGDIGKEYNQDAGKEFSFKDFGSDDFVAKNSEAITGGEATEQKAVDKNDRTNAKDLLTQALEVQATNTLKQQLGETLMVVDQTQVSDLEEITYDKKAGEEGDELTAEGFITTTALAVNKADFDRILLKALTAQIPQTFQPTSAGMQSQITAVEEIVEDEDAKTKNDEDVEKGIKMQIKVKATVKIMPKLDFNQIKQAIRGKSPEVADEYLKTLPNFGSSEINVHPRLPGFLGILPQKTERIGIMVEESN